MGVLNSSIQNDRQQLNKIFVLNPLANTFYPENAIKIQTFPFQQIISKKHCKVIINQKQISHYFYHIRLFHHKVIIFQTLQQQNQNFIFDFLNRIKFSNNYIEKHLKAENNSQQIQKPCQSICSQILFPVVLIMSRLRPDVIRRILNLFQFYEINIIKYPSVQIFVAANCNARKIICCVNELQEFSKFIYKESYPQNQSEINLYCYCKEDQDTQIILKYTKMKKQGINIKFNFNMVKLLHDLLSNKDLGAQQAKQLKSGTTLNSPVQSIQIMKTKQLIKGRTSINNSSAIMSSTNKVQQKKQKKNHTVLFYIHQKQKDSYSIRSLTQKIFRIVRTMKIKQITSMQSLLQKIKHMSVAIVIVSQNFKVYIEVCQNLQAQGLEEKVILVKRNDIDTADNLAQKILKIKERGFFRYQNLKTMNYLKKSIIVFGSKNYLEHIFTVYPYIKVKMFVDISIFKEHPKIREIISRKNQLIVANMKICECMDEFRGLIKSQIIYYEYSSQKEISGLILNKKGSCSCSCEINSSQDCNNISLTLNQLLEQQPISIVNFNYYKNKAIIISKQIQAILTKIKEKKYLSNVFQNQYDQILFLHPEHYNIQKILALVIRFMNNRYINNWLCPTTNKAIITQCFQQISNAVNIQFDSLVNIKNGQLSQIYQTQYRQIYEVILDCPDNLDLFTLASKLALLLIDNFLFRKCVNYLWKNFLGINKNEYSQPTPILFFILFLSLRKGYIFDSKSTQVLKSRKLITKKMIHINGEYAQDQIKKKHCYLRLINFQKSQDENIIKFFTGKSNVMNFVYTSQFLVFQQINQNQIEHIGLKQVLQKEKEKIMKSNLLSSNLNQKMYNSDSPFIKATTLKNIQEIYSIQNSIIIYIEDLDALTFDIFSPFFKNQQSKKYLIPPFTKLYVNRQFDSLTHQLKLSLTYQQKCVQRFLQNFIVQKGLMKDEDYSEQLLDPTELLQEQNTQFIKKNPFKTNRQEKQESINLRILNEDFRISKNDLFFICMNECKYFTAHHILKTKLPKSYISNAYKVMILTRKGLYFQAERSLWKSNPYYESLSSYILQLRKRLHNQTTQQLEEYKQKQVKKVKWVLKFESNSQKFYLLDSDKDKFCFNQDSLNTIYYQTIKQSPEIRAKETKQSTFLGLNQKEGFLQTFPQQRNFHKSNISSGISSINPRSAINFSKESQQNILAQLRIYQNKQTSQFLALNEEESRTCLNYQTSDKSSHQSTSKYHYQRTSIKMKSNYDKNESKRIHVRMRNKSNFLKREEEKRKTQIISEVQNLDYFDDTQSTNSLLKFQDQQCLQKSLLFQQFGNLNINSDHQNLLNLNQYKAQKQQNLRKSIFTLDLSSDSSFNEFSDQQVIVVKPNDDVKNKIKQSSIFQNKSIDFLTPKIKKKSILKSKNKPNLLSVQKQEFNPRESERSKKIAQFTFMKRQDQNLIQPLTNEINSQSIKESQKYIQKINNQAVKKKVSIFQPKNFRETDSIRITKNQEQQICENNPIIQKTIFKGMLDNKFSQKSPFSIVLNCSERKLKKNKQQDQVIEQLEQKRGSQNFFENQSSVSIQMDYLKPFAKNVDESKNKMSKLGYSIQKERMQKQNLKRVSINDSKVMNYERVCPIESCQSEYQKMSNINKSLTNLRLNIDLRRKR